MLRRRVKEDERVWVSASKTSDWGYMLTADEEPSQAWRRFEHPGILRYVMKHHEDI